MPERVTCQGNRIMSQSAPAIWFSQTPIFHSKPALPIESSLCSNVRTSTLDMDVFANGRNIHLPAEMGDNIASQLRDETDLRNTSHIDRIFNSGAIKQLCDLTIFPSEPFVLPEGAREYSVEPWPCFTDSRVRMLGHTAVWTCLCV